MLLNVTTQEFNHILAALRLFQAVKSKGPIDIDFMPWIEGIATDGGCDSMTVEEIDDLCMKINTRPDPDTD